MQSFPRFRQVKLAANKLMGISSILAFPTHFDTFIFDLDGVIIDSEHLTKYAFCEAYHRVVGEGEPPLEEYWQHLGDAFPNIMNKMGLPVAMWQPFREVSSSRLDLIEVFPGIREILDFLSDYKIKLGILTGKDWERTQQILHNFELHDYFSVVVTPELIANPKPHPDGLFYALDRLNSKKENAVFIGDSINDMMCAKSANVTGIGALWGEEVSIEKVVVLAECTVKSPSELLAALESKLVLVA